jgi:hypothetical protein
MATISVVPDFPTRRGASRCTLGFVGHLAMADGTAYRECLCSPAQLVEPRGLDSATEEDISGQRRL